MRARTDREKRINTNTQLAVNNTDSSGSSGNSTKKKLSNRTTKIKAACNKAYIVRSSACTQMAGCGALATIRLRLHLRSTHYKNVFGDGVTLFSFWCRAFFHFRSVRPLWQRRKLSAYSKMLLLFFEAIHKEKEKNFSSRKIHLTLASIRNRCFFLSPIISPTKRSSIANIKRYRNVFR